MTNTEPSKAAIDWLERHTAYEGEMKVFMARLLDRYTAASPPPASYDDGVRDGRKQMAAELAPGWESRGMAFRMIQDAVEELGPTGAVPSRDVGPPNPEQDAEDIIAGIQATIDARVRDERARCAAVALDEAHVIGALPGSSIYSACRQIAERIEAGDAPPQSEGVKSHDRNVD